MQLFWLMDRQELERLTLWKDLNIMQAILREVLFLEAWKKSSGLFKCSQTRIQLSW